MTSPLGARAEAFKRNFQNGIDKDPVLCYNLDTVKERRIKEMTIQFYCNGKVKEVEYAEDTPEDVIQAEFDEWLICHNDVWWYKEEEEEE